MRVDSASVEAENPLGEDASGCHFEGEDGSCGYLEALIAHVVNHGISLTARGDCGKHRSDLFGEGLIKLPLERSGCAEIEDAGNGKARRLRALNERAGNGNLCAC